MKFIPALLLIVIFGSAPLTSWAAPDYSYWPEEEQKAIAAITETVRQNALNPMLFYETPLWDPIEEQAWKTFLAENPEAWLPVEESLQPYHEKNTGRCPHNEKGMPGHFTYAYTGADAVFAGTVKGVAYLKDHTPPVKVTLTATRIFKGDLTAGQTVDIFTSPEQDYCGKHYAVDIQYFVFADKEGAGGVYLDSYSSLTAPVDASPGLAGSLPNMKIDPRKNLNSWVDKVHKVRWPEFYDRPRPGTKK